MTFGPLLPDLKLLAELSLVIVEYILCKLSLQEKAVVYFGWS